MKCVGAVSRHTPVLSVFEGCSRASTAQHKAKALIAGFLMDRYRTEEFIYLLVTYFTELTGRILIIRSYKV